MRLPMRLRTAVAPLALLPCAGACIVTQVRYVPVPAGSAYSSVSTAGGPVSAAAAACTPDAWARANRPTACEVRTFVLTPGRGTVDVESGNGSVDVTAADTARVVTVAARVRAWAANDDEARQLLGSITVTVDGNSVRARSPRDAWGDHGERGWAVDYTVVTPRRLDVAARTGNGAVRVRGLVGRLRLSSGNGSVTLDDVGGSVRGTTGNGAVSATLAGRAWNDGGLSDAGLELHSGNGSALLRVPTDYSARLDVSTGNGALTVDFPVTLQGRIDPRRLALTLGSGGAPLKVSTGNGRATVARAE